MKLKNKKISHSKRNAIQYFLNTAKSSLQPWLIKLILYGSVSKDTSEVKSDIDILLVHIASDDYLLDKISQLSFETALKFGEYVEAIPISYYEYKTRKDISSFLREVEKGEVLYMKKKSEVNKIEAYDYLNLGEEFLDYGKAAYKRKEYRDAIDDAYNGVELFVKALILLAGNTLARSHGGIIQQFGKLYILTEKLSKKTGRNLNKALILRGSARYNPKAILKREHAKMVINLGEEIYKFLKNKI